jgi:tripartite-type tricarboxylate transporter receptor subunit TctC
MIVAALPGSINDVGARSLAERMRGSLGQPIIIENVGGADGTIGTGRAARAKPDGYTIGVGSLTTNVMNGAFYLLPYDPLNDFAPVAPVGTIPVVLFARKTLPAKDLRELIDWLKANPAKASAGNIAVAARLLYTVLQKETDTRFTLVPYRGGPAAIQDIIAGQIDLLLAAPVFLPLVRAGNIKAYAVTSEARTPSAPDIPTFTEMGLPALSYSQWFGLFTPKGTPRDIIERLNAAVVEALADPAVRSRLVGIGLDIFPRERQTPDAFGALVKTDAEKWWPTIKQLGIKAE